MLYIMPVDKAKFVSGISIPEDAVYVRVTLGGVVWRANNPKFYKDIESSDVLSKMEKEGKLTIIKK